ncbi:hypothetical protein [Desulfofundulus salinus]|uniref:Uncharacterized protein n=1 Tax=Desulfofundulus salinus TaxID=2419843 RepID=A0A494WSW4_9FIRM|nr:hypothetical protein [Desulfofundulus salinum]RKO66408.1 hypothetical protein D7024_05245 [Desulfofundulus salinum]
MFEPAYTRLARAVVLQAVKDAVNPVRCGSRDYSVRNIKADARKFIRKAVLEDGYEHGIFELAGVDPRRVLAHLEERMKTHVDSGRRGQHRGKYEPGAGAQVQRAAEQIPGAATAGVF